MQFPLSLSPWIEALKPVAQCGANSPTCSNSFWDSVITNFLLVPTMPFATSSNTTWTATRIMGGLFFPPMLIPSVEGVIRHTYRLVNCFGKSEEPVAKAAGLLDSVKSMVVGVGTPAQPAASAFRLGSTLSAIGINLAGTMLSSLMVLDTLSKRIMANYPSADNYAQSIFQLSKGAAIDQCNAQALEGAASIGFGYSLFAKSMEYLGAGVYLWPLLKGYRDEGIDAVLGELPYYLTFAAYHDMLPMAVTMPVGLFAQSMGMGLLSSRSSHEIGRYLLLLSPLPIKYMLKGSWKMLTFFISMPLISIPKMIWEEAKLCSFHGFAIWRVNSLKASMLNGAVLADSIVKRGWSCAMLPQMA